MEPTRSQNMTVRCRRSPCWASTEGACVRIGSLLIAGGVCGAISDAPQLPQKFDVGGFSAPHLAHSVISAFPQCAQKLLPGGLLVSHFEQRIGLPELAKRRFIYHLTAREHYRQSVQYGAPFGGDGRRCHRAWLFESEGKNGRNAKMVLVLSFENVVSPEPQTL